VTKKCWTRRPASDGELTRKTWDAPTAFARVLDSSRLHRGLDRGIIVLHAAANAVVQYGGWPGLCA